MPVLTSPVLVFRRGYFILFVLLLVTEILIAVYLHDAIIRPYGGDFLVVILMYCLVKSFLNVPLGPAVVSVLLFAYLLEGLQYIHIVRILGLEKFLLARVIIGTSFAWTDIGMYSLGILLVILVELSIHHKKALP